VPLAFPRCRPFTAPKSVIFLFIAAAYTPFIALCSRRTRRRSSRYSLGSGVDRSGVEAWLSGPVRPSRHHSVLGFGLERLVDL
jgi:hypothetical protein